MREWLAILENPGIVGMIRIVRSEDHPNVLIRRLDLTGAAPFGFKLVFKIRLRDVCFPILNKVQLSLIHSNAGNGWFRITGSRAVTKVKQEIVQCILKKYNREIRGIPEEMHSEVLLHAAGSILDLEGIRCPDHQAEIFVEMEILKILLSRIRDNFCLSEDHEIKSLPMQPMGIELPRR